MAIHVLVGCTDPLLTEAVHAIAGAHRFPGPTLRHVAARPSEVMARVAQADPDVLLLEQGLPGLHLVHLRATVRELGLRTRTLVVQRERDDAEQLQSLREGASGALPAAELRTLGAKAIRAVHEGQMWFPRRVMGDALRELARSEPAGIELLASDDALTPREGEILRLIGSGLTNKEIARQLRISDYTVKTHLHRVYVKLNRSGRYKAFAAHSHMGG